MVIREGHLLYFFFDKNMLQEKKMYNLHSQNNDRIVKNNATNGSYSQNIICFYTSMSAMSLSLLR